MRLYKILSMLSCIHRKLDIAAIFSEDYMITRLMLILFSHCIEKEMFLKGRKTKKRIRFVILIRFKINNLRNNNFPAHGPGFVFVFYIDNVTT